MDKLHINSQFINNLNSTLDEPYFNVIAMKTTDRSTPITYTLLLIFRGQSIMNITLNTGSFEIREGSELEGTYINNMMNELEKMMLKDLMFGKIGYYTDINGRQIKTLRTCIFEIENGNNG